MKKNDEESVEIQQNNIALSKEVPHVVDGHFVTFFKEVPGITWHGVKVKPEFVEELIEDEDWELVSSSAVFDDEINKTVYRRLNDESKTIEFSDDTVHIFSNSIIFKNDELGFLTLGIGSLFTDVESGDEDENALVYEIDTKTFKDYTIKRKGDDEDKTAEVDLAIKDNEESRQFLNYLLKNYFAYEEREDKAMVKIITMVENDYVPTEFPIDFKTVDFENHYNDGLGEFHNKIIEGVTDKSDHSFFILHGKPGTGKTSYIRYLIYALGKNEKVIYLPPTMVDALADPSFVNFMQSNSGSVLVIEDAEEAIKQNADNRNSATYNLLNLTDGILGDCYNIDVICTFNSDIKEVDPAIIRKGRLNGIFKFEELDEEKAKKLANELNVELPENKFDWTLGNIMNADEEDNKFNTKKKLGFERKNKKK